MGFAAWCAWAIEPSLLKSLKVTVDPGPDILTRGLAEQLTATWFTARPRPLTCPAAFLLAAKIWTGSTSPVATVASMSLQARIADSNVPLITHDPP
jgi:hypothetical protein